MPTSKKRKKKNGKTAKYVPYMERRAKALKTAENKKKEQEKMKGRLKKAMQQSAGYVTD